jgi:hypothetical protein
MEISLKRIGSREFWAIDDEMIPVDRIKSIDLKAPNGGCDNAVQIHTDDPDEVLIWAYASADELRAWIKINAQG